MAAATAGYAAVDETVALRSCFEDPKDLRRQGRMDDPRDAILTAPGPEPFRRCVLAWHATLTGAAKDRRPVLHARAIGTLPRIVSTRKRHGGEPLAGRS